MRAPSALMLAGGTAIGALLAGGRFNPGPQHPRTASWYARLDKPGFTPPAPIFGIAWPLLDGLLWLTGYRLLRAPTSQARSTSIVAWLVTLLGIPGYSWAFFGRHRADEGLGASASMLAGSVDAGRIVRQGRPHRCLGHRTVDRLVDVRHRAAGGGLAPKPMSVVRLRGLPLVNRSPLILRP